MVKKAIYFQSENGIDILNEVLLDYYVWFLLYGKGREGWERWMEGIEIAGELTNFLASLEYYTWHVML